MEMKSLLFEAIETDVTKQKRVGGTTLGRGE
jgi:hypothetical protein